jgi:RsiW-degrading membrane proteinase PrsW (M82 family)
LLPIGLLVLIGAAPSVFLLVFFYLKDRYEPEPRGHVAAAFLKGAVAIVPAYLAAHGLERLVGREWLVFGGLPARLFEAGVLAAGVEELAKWLLFFCFIYRWDEFDEPLDGVVYGVALALGFATVENVLMVLRSDLELGLLRALFAVPAHALFGAAMGFYFGRAKLGAGRLQAGAVPPRIRWRRLGAALALPMVFHAGYDFTLIELRGRWMYVVVGVLSFGLWQFVLRRVRRAQEDSPFKQSVTATTTRRPEGPLQ